jgi:hypothetical protein
MSEIMEYSIAMLSRFGGEHLYSALRFLAIMHWTPLFNQATVVGPTDRTISTFTNYFVLGPVVLTVVLHISCTAVPSWNSTMHFQLFPMAISDFAGRSADCKEGGWAVAWCYGRRPDGANANIVGQFLGFRLRHSIARLCLACSRSDGIDRDLIRYRSLCLIRTPGTPNGRRIRLVVGLETGPAAFLASEPRLPHGNAA